MASKRVMSSAINWAALAERVPESQKVFFNALKARSDGYLRRVMANPEAAPKIDWAMYKSKVAIPGLVENFQKQYDSFQVPYPPDKVSSQIDAQQKETEQEVARFIQESTERIKSHEKKITAWDSVLPYEEMTLEDFKEAHPDAPGIDQINNPSLWPHTPEEQPGYKPSEEAAPAGH